MSNINKTNKEILEDARKMIGLSPYNSYSTSSDYQRLLLELCVRLAEADAKLAIYEKRPLPLTKP